MGKVNKGTVGSISGNTVRVVSSDASARPTAKITNPWHLRGNRGKLKKGTEVVFVEFDDSTGLLLDRADGEAEMPSGGDEYEVMTNEELLEIMNR